VTSAVWPAAELNKRVVSGLAKTLLMRNGGLRSHRAVLPFFLGLMAGDFTAASLRMLFLPAVAAG